MARSLATRVAAARPARAGSGVARARPAPPRVGVGQAQKAGGAIGLSGNQALPAPAPKTTSSPAAAPAPAPKPAGVPWDAQAEREWGAGEQAYNDKYAGIQGDWKSREEWYGLGETNNPYSQASLLSHRHEVDKRTVMNSAGLQLYSGSTVNRRAGADRSFNVGLETLKAAYAADRARKDREEAEARHAWEREQGEIREGPVTRAAETEPPPAPEPAGGGGGGEGGGGGGGQPGLGGDPAHPRAFRAGVGAGKPKPNAPPGYHAYKGPNNQWWFAPNS